MDSPPLPGDVIACEVNGSTLAYLERGRGEPVVFVHGDISDLRMWLAQVDVFAAAGYRAVVYNRLHAWPNPPLGSGRVDPLLGHVADLEALLEARALGAAHLVGNSFGASICLTLAARRPELVRSLVVQEPPAVELLLSGPRQPAALLSLLVRRPRMAVALMRFGLGTMSPAARALARGDLERALEGFCPDILGADSLRALPESRRQQMRDNAGTFQAHLTGPLPPTAQQVRRIDAPALLVTGAHSHRTLKLLTNELHRLLPSSEQVEIPGACHFAPPLDPDVLLGGDAQRLAEREWALWKPRWGVFHRTPLDQHLRADSTSPPWSSPAATTPTAPRAAVYGASERDYRVPIAADAVSRVRAHHLDEAHEMGVLHARSAEITKLLGRSSAEGC